MKANGLPVSPFSLLKPLREAKETAIVSLAASRRRNGAVCLGGCRRPMILSLSVCLLDGDGSVRLSVSPFSLSKPLEEAKKTAIMSLSASRRPLILSLSVGLLDGDGSVLSVGLLESKGKSIVQFFNHACL